MGSRLRISWSRAAEDGLFGGRVGSDAMSRGGVVKAGGGVCLDASDGQPIVEFQCGALSPTWRFPDRAVDVSEQGLGSGSVVLMRPLRS
jgi:hypothetical protein